jgi:hypothetical protein
MAISKLEQSFDMWRPVVLQIQINGTQLVTESEFGAIRNLTGYVKREGFWGGICTILHRIWNAIKAIFGQSDWQKAEKALSSIIDRGFASAIDQNIPEATISTIKGRVPWALKDTINEINRFDNTLQRPAAKAARNAFNLLLGGWNNGAADRIMRTKEIDEVTWRIAAEQLDDAQAMTLIANKFVEFGILPRNWQQLPQMTFLFGHQNPNSIIRCLPPELMNLILTADQEVAHCKNSDLPQE